jgi:16S rRNA (guanine966-N2)-methyltransferase
MNVRVVAGLYGGRKIETPEGKKTHPMGERVKNAMFNTIGEEIKAAKVLDAFAGSGALGIEAISRGAAQATFVERDRVAQKVIENNIKLLGIDDQAKIIKSSVASWINTYEGDFFDFIFVDPPYHDLQLSTVSQLMGLLKPGALMVLSHPGRSESPTGASVVVVDNRSYGDAALTYFRKEV